MTSVIDLMKIGKNYKKLKYTYKFRASFIDQLAIYRRVGYMPMYYRSKRF